MVLNVVGSNPINHPKKSGIMKVVPGFFFFDQASPAGVALAAGKAIPSRFKTSRKLASLLCCTNVYSCVISLNKL